MKPTVSSYFQTSCNHCVEIFTAGDMIRLFSGSNDDSGNKSARGGALPEVKSL